MLRNDQEKAIVVFPQYQPVHEKYDHILHSTANTQRDIHKEFTKKMYLIENMFYIVGNKNEK